MSTTGDEALQTRLSRRRVRRRAAFVVLLVLATGAVVFASRSDGPGHRLIYAETLSDGRVFQCFSDGAFIGSAGSEVDSREAPQASGGAEPGPAFVVRPPDYTEEEARRAVEEYRESGRSPDQDLAEFDRLSAECRRRR